MLLNSLNFDELLLMMFVGYMIFAIVWYAYYLPRNSIIERRKKDKECAVLWQNKLKSVAIALLACSVINIYPLLIHDEFERAVKVAMAGFLFLIIPALCGIITGYSMTQSNVEALNRRHLWFRN